MEALAPASCLEVCSSVVTNFKDYGALRFTNVYERRVAFFGSLIIRGSYYLGVDSRSPVS